MDIDWDDLKTILAVVREGTLGRAAQGLGVNYTTVARRITRAEEALGQKLFERLTEGYRPTDIGLLAARHAEQMEQHQNALMRQLQGRDETLRGPLVITAPQILLNLHLVHVIDRFCTLHPEVDLSVNSANDLVDLGRRRADLAIRVSANPGDALKGLRLCDQHTAAFASPEIARRIAQAPEAATGWIVYDQTKGVPEAALARNRRAFVRARFDDMIAMIGAAQAGLGVVRMPMFIGRGTPGLVQVPVMEPSPYAPIWAVAHADVWPGAKVSAFRALLRAYFREHRRVFAA
ncbi:LysR family transcriptional regulator [uncultured Roseovarius sp.]|uniref:LysR family transcriptional regulator n=1 Tax=Roseovarius sp. TaxID=1486281 RepID=UPI0025DA2093|nr:LysR family transcriptional regulator [uncultured Roseovarius sp.]